jgi:hypothetical protein
LHSTDLRQQLLNGIQHIAGVRSNMEILGTLFFVLIVVLPSLLLGLGGFFLTRGRRQSSVVALIGLLLPIFGGVYTAALLNVQSANEVRMGRRADNSDWLFSTKSKPDLPLGAGYFSVEEGFQDLATFLTGPNRDEGRPMLSRLGCAGKQVVLRLSGNSSGQSFALIDTEAKKLRYFSTPQELSKAVAQPSVAQPLVWGAGSVGDVQVNPPQYPVGLTLPAPCTVTLPASDTADRMIQATKKPQIALLPPLLVLVLYGIWIARIRRQPKTTPVGS